MPVVRLHRPEQIEPVLRRNVFLNIYALGDLDPAFWPFTTWYALEDAGTIRAILLLYTAFETPTLMALGDPPFDDTNELLRRARGLRVDGGLVSAGGCHVYSPAQRVAALGNIVTHPAHRGRGHAAAVTARLRAEVLKTVDHVGLNVKSDNATAVRCYERLGFRPVAGYEEVGVTLGPS